MIVRRFSNGDLLVPVGGEDPSGVLWDGVERVATGSEQHAEWMEWLGSVGREPVLMSPDEQRAAVADARRRRRPRQ